MKCYNMARGKRCGCQACVDHKSARDLAVRSLVRVDTDRTRFGAAEEAKAVAECARIEAWTERTLASMAELLDGEW